MQFLQKIIIGKITSYKKISLFFHEIPDFDALGSCFALRRFIKDKFPDKEVEIIGLDTLDPSFGKTMFEFTSYHVPNQFLKNSLGIILDTANSSRIWSMRHKFCKELIRIDHHPHIETIAEIEWVETSAPATCEMVGNLLMEWDSKFIVSNTAAYLYAGILTDTGRFLYLSTRPSTLELASKLLSFNFDRQKLNDIIYLKSLKQSKFESFVVSKLKVENKIKFGYAIIPKNSFNKFNLDLRLSMVHVFNNIIGFEVWMTVYYDDTVKKWRGSLRSRRIPINRIAEKYNGGGHKLAAGFTLKNYLEYKKLLKDIREYLHEEITRTENEY